jgi:hypothetical protein
VVQTVYRAVFGAALIHPGHETRALVRGCNDGPADLLAIVDGLDADHPDNPSSRYRRHGPRHSRRGQPFAGTERAHFTWCRRAGSEERKRKEFINKVERGAAVVPGWTPDFSFYPMGLT